MEDLKNKIISAINKELDRDVKNAETLDVLNRLLSTVSAHTTKV